MRLVRIWRRVMSAFDPTSLADLTQLQELVNATRTEQTHKPAAILRVFAWFRDAPQHAINRLNARAEFQRKFVGRIMYFRTMEPSCDTPDSPSDQRIVWQLRHISPYTLHRMLWTQCCFFIGVFGDDRRIWCDEECGGVLCARHQQWLINAERMISTCMPTDVARLCLEYITPDYYKIPMRDVVPIPDASANAADVTDLFRAILPAIRLSRALDQPVDAPDI